ncbi:MAG: acetyl-CoA hydrolase/transferase family protein [Marmoricola sp.]
MTPKSSSIDLTQYVKPGDLVVWGQACSEPRTLTEQLAVQAERIGPVRCFVGIPADSAITVDTVGALEVFSYCGAGTNAALHDAGRLQIVPAHYSDLPAMLMSGSLRADVVFVQVSPPDANGRHSLGLGDDYFSAAIGTARTVIAEVNDQVPFTFGARTLMAYHCAAMIHTSRTPGTMPTPLVSDQTAAVARQVAGLVQDGATLQFGIGALPEAVLDQLGGHRDLGIHSGIINDAALRLIESGVATGQRKTLDRRVAIGGLLGGTERLFRFAHRNGRIELRCTKYTHDPEILGQSYQLTAINAALEVDLTGQVNAEVAAGRYVGAIGGAVDFLRGAARSRGGIPIVALPSHSRGTPRIVAKLSGPVSTPRSEEIVVVTEHGVADLRGLPLEKRVERMLAIADPAHRDELALAAEQTLAS